MCKPMHIKQCILKSNILKKKKHIFDKRYLIKRNVCPRNKIIKIVQRSSPDRRSLFSKYRIFILLTSGKEFEIPQKDRQY